MPGVISLEIEFQGETHRKGTLVFPGKLIGTSLPEIISGRKRMLIISCDFLDRRTEVFECDEPENFYSLASSKQQALLQAGCTDENLRQCIETDEPVRFTYSKDHNNFACYLVRHAALLVSDYHGSSDQYQNLDLRDAA